MNTLKVAGKFLDQPMLVAKFHNAVPAILTTAATAYTVKEVSNEPQHKRKKSSRKNRGNNGLNRSFSTCRP